MFLAIAYGLWALNQGLNLYYELGRHMDAPDNSIADPVLFLHIVPLMAAVATLPHRNVSDRKPYRAILNSLLLLFFWGFLYGYFVFPYQYLFSLSATPASYGVRFDILYLLENLALVLACRYFDPSRAASLEVNLSSSVGRLHPVHLKFRSRQPRN